MWVQCPQSIQSGKRETDIKVFLAFLQNYSVIHDAISQPTWRCFYLIYRKHDTQGHEWIWMEGKNAEPLTKCSSLSTSEEANTASKNNKLNFCWNKNGRAWKSSLPSDIGSLIFINGRWNSPLLPLVYGEKERTDNTICMQAERQTLPVHSLTPAWNPQQPLTPLYALFFSLNPCYAPSYCTFRGKHSSF